MKVLILTANTGGGHNSTAKNIQKLCNDNDIDTEIYDILDNKKEIEFLRETLSKESLYEKMIKYAPDIYRTLYYLSNNDVVKVLNRLVRDYSENLYSKIKEYRPDVIVSAHPMGVAMVKRYERKKYDIDIPYVQIITDFHAHKIYVDSIVEAYITPSEYTSYILAEAGVKLNKTYSYGIPIADKFKNSEVKSHLSNEIMIMLGSWGFVDNMEKIYALLEHNTEQTFHFITAKNTELKEELEKRFKDKIKNKKLYVYGFIDNIDEIMRRVDLVITKPGGLSLTECITMKKPMILVNPIPGQEEENLKIREIYGVGKSGIKEDIPIYNIVEELYNNPSEFNDMISGITRLTRDYSNDKIVELIKNIKNGKNS